VNAGGATDKPASLRLFFALWPGAQEQQALLRASAPAVADSAGRPIAAANLHATLAFLGNVAAARLPQLRTAAQELAMPSGAGPRVLQLQFEALEHWVRPQILCATARAALPDAHFASALAAAIKQTALAAGFAPDLKPFRAHVTVARKVARAPEVQPMARVTWNCEAFALVASTTGASGSVYSVLESYPLDRSEKARK
jgi:RNA 2',3'-cyclic 3'-phosphodiesterase